MPVFHFYPQFQHLITYGAQFHSFLINDRKADSLVLHCSGISVAVNSRNKNLPEMHDFPADLMSNAVVPCETLNFENPEMSILQAFCHAM